MQWNDVKPPSLFMISFSFLCFLINKLDYYTSIVGYRIKQKIQEIFIIKFFALKFKENSGKNTQKIKVNIKYIIFILQKLNTIYSIFVLN